MDVSSPPYHLPSPICERQPTSVLVSEYTLLDLNTLFSYLFFSFQKIVYNKLSGSIPNEIAMMENLKLLVLREYSEVDIYLDNHNLIPYLMLTFEFLFFMIN